MNAKQIVFADEYIKSRNATEAYLIAYPNSSRKAAGTGGMRLLKNADISEYIKKHSNDIKNHNKRIADAKEIMEYFTSVIRGDITDTVVTPSGVAVEIPSKISDRTVAAEKLARMLGYDRDIDRRRLKLEERRIELEERKQMSGVDDDSRDVVIEV